MTLDQTVLQIAGQAFSLAQVLLAGAGLALLLIIITTVLAWRGQKLRREESLETLRRASDLEFRLAEMAGQLRSFADQAASGQQHLTRTLDERLDQVSHRVGRGLNEQAERTHQSLKHLYERLAVIDTAQANLTQLSSEMVSLKDILANKQARGAYGQARMEAIIRDGLHGHAFTFQATLSNGSRPDCLIKLPESELRLVLDAKFPLEAFNALKSASGEAALRAAETRLRRDVIHHVKDIAEKYLIAGETHETAIMFVPSESIYADLYEKFEDVIQKAHRERVIVASPNVLMLLIQTMQAIFKDARMREQAGVIKIEVTRLLEDVGRLKDRVLDLQRHFGQASGDLEKLGLSADKITKRGLRIEQLDVEDPARIANEEAQLRLVQGQ
ncbi:MAG: DNA recombination protein RmuC [Alphaproteobacteria bacterium]|nr:MAG: DNA recombination protein RmuC [Alphaproteobacteria bacterium]